MYIASKVSICFLLSFDINITTSLLYTTTTTFLNTSLYVSKTDDVFDLDPNGCHGKECHYGVVRPWSKHCSFSEDSCDGTLVNVTGQCCPICEVTVKTSLQSTESQSTSTPKSAPTTSKVWVIRGQTYTLSRWFVVTLSQVIRKIQEKQ